MPVALLDVNVLVALFDPDHVHHEIAHDWFADQRGAGWATCPATEQGFVRVLSHPAYGAAVARPVELVDRLRQFCASGQHVFWHDTVSITDLAVVRPSHLRGHRHVTGVALLALAVRMGGCLATFDRAISLSAVVGATRASLAVIAPPGDAG